MLTNSLYVIWSLSVPELICLHILKYKDCYLTRILLFDGNNSPCKTFYSSIWSIDGNLTGTTTPGQRGPECNSYEILHIPKSPRL